MDDQFHIPNNSETRLFLILAAVISFLFFVSLIFGTKIQRGDISVPSETASTPFSEINISARAVYVYDVQTKKVLFVKNENIRLPLASLTKIMSALVATDLSPSYGNIVIGDDAIKAEGDSGLYPNENWSLNNLLDFSLMTSSNDGIRAVALSLGALSKSDATSKEIINDFVMKMNHKANELGLKNTYFLNETGLDESDIKGGAYGTARDMNILVEYILMHHPEIFEVTKEASTILESLDNRQHIAKNTNIITAEIPGLRASKTGFTDTAGGNLIVAFDPEIGRPIIISILGSTEQGRFEDMRALIKASMEYINNN